MPNRTPLPILPDVIEKLGLGVAQLRFILAGGGVWFADGAELLLISAVTSSVAADWNLNAMQRGSMVTVVYIGVLLGNLISGPLSDKHGRRELIMTSYIGIFTFSIMSSLMMNFWSLCVLRLFVGMSFGLGQPPVNVLIAEVTPSKWRGTANALSQGLFCLGETFSSVLIWLDDPTMLYLNWRRLLQLGALPALLFWVAGALFLPQSPYFLAYNGHHREAKEVLAVMRGDNSVPHVSVDFEERPAQPIAEDTSLYSQWHKIGTGALMTTTFIMSFTCFCANLVFYGTLYAFANILPLLNAPVVVVPGAEPVATTSAAMQLTLGAMWEVPGMLLAALAGMFLPRKPVLMASSLIGTISLVVFVVGATGGHGWLPSFEWHLGYYANKCIIQCFFTTAYIYISEVYPTEVRATGCSFCFAFGRLGCMGSPLMYEALEHATGSYVCFFYALGVLSCVNTILISLLPFETFGAPLSDTMKDLEEKES